jgi:predicted MarR family transcription regulator
MGIQLIAMKRDWELIREILTRLEKTQSSKACLRSDELSDYDADAVAYQMKMLIQAGLIEGLRGCRHCTAYSLTWEGHEFLDTIRSKPIWDSATIMLQEKGIEMSIDAFKTAARIAIGGIFGERQ